MCIESMCMGVFPNFSIKLTSHDGARVNIFILGRESFRVQNAVLFLSAKKAYNKIDF